MPFDSPAAELLPAKPDGAPVIAFIGGSADLGAPGSPEQAQFGDGPARLSRVLPLYLAEQVEFATDAITRSLLSWMVKPTPGFILGGKNWDDATGARHARQSVPDEPADYLVIIHLVCREDPWTIELRLVRTIDAACLATVSGECSARNPGAGLPGLVADLLVQVATHVAPPDAARESDFRAAPTIAYLRALDQLLAVLTAGLGPAASKLSAERQIIESQLQLCLGDPQSIPVRLLFAQVLRAFKKVRPDLLPEFRARVDQLQAENPLPEPAHSVATQVLAEVFAD